MSEEKSTDIESLKKLREPFKPNQIGKLPKPTKQQTQEVKNDFKAGMRCTDCGGWHHPKVVHLDYVGHAALTDRFLDVDPTWSWEPMAKDANGLPFFDQIGGLWINLTICGVTRSGYGHPDGKVGGNAIKESIGDALRNAGMRFGAALDLWHKGDLHVDADDAPDTAPAASQPAAAKIPEIDQIQGWINAEDANSISQNWKGVIATNWQQLNKAQIDKLNQIMQGAQR